MCLVGFRQAHPPDYDVDRESGKLNREEYQRTHSTLTLFRLAMVGGIDSVN